MPSPSPNAPHRINLWSGPRNVSTALMYSFAQRTDTRVVDEPLYGHYLRVSHADHPAAEAVMQAMDTDGERVVREIILGPVEAPTRTDSPGPDSPGLESLGLESLDADRPSPSVLFFKQMAHHLVDLDLGFLAATTHVLLIRDPREMLPSLAHQIPEPSLRDTSLDRQSRLFDELRALGQDPPVLESRELLKDPEGVLRRLCDRLGLPFEPAMLRWAPGPRPEDGVWAPHWYHNVHKSSGFLAYKPKRQPFPAGLEPLLAECLPHYDRLFEHAIRAGRPAPAPDGR